LPGLDVQDHRYTPDDRATPARHPFGRTRGFDVWYEPFRDAMARRQPRYPQSGKSY